MDLVEYPALEIVESGEGIAVKAGRKSVDAHRRILYEGVVIFIPNLTKKFKEIVFAVMSIEAGKENKTYTLGLHTHTVEAGSVCCELDTSITVSKELLVKWTGLQGGDIDRALRKVHVGYTYSLLASLPRIITVTPKKVVVMSSVAQPVDSMNVCDLLLKNKHPLDMSKPKKK